MPTYRPPVSRDQLLDLEHYLFALMRLTQSVEFVNDFAADAHDKILREISYIDQTISILKNMFAGTGNAIPIVGRDNYDDPLIEKGYSTVYYFSSAALAARCLDLNPSHIAGVCKGDRKHCGGWIFQYQEEYELETIDFDLSGPKFDIIEINNGKKDPETPETNGDV